MKNKKYIICVVISVVIISITFAVMTNAEQTGTESTVSIEFEEGDANVGPLDPDEPEFPGNGGTGESGSLALNHISDFYFEKQEILTHIAEYPTTTIKPYIQVTDARGTGEGWAVRARASRFKTDSNKYSLFGASMTLNDASCISSIKDEPPPSPIPKDPVTIKFNDADLAKVVTAEEDEGIGTWLTRWYINTEDDTEPLLNNSVLLTVPSASALSGVNRAKITWILSSGPA